MATWRHPSEGFPDWQEQLEPLRRFLRRWGHGRVVRLVPAVVVLLWLASGFYVVRPAERGVVLLFGRVVAETEPGLRYRLPWPIQTHQVADVRIKRADLPPEVQASVFARMQAERQRIAMRYRAEGGEKARETVRCLRAAGRPASLGAAVERISHG